MVPGGMDAPVRVKARAFRVSTGKVTRTPPWRGATDRFSVSPTDKMEAAINLGLMHLRRLLSSMDYQPELSLQRFDIDDYNGDAVRVAQLARRHWGVPSGPLHNLTALAERAGCIVLCRASSKASASMA